MDFWQLLYKLIEIKSHFKPQVLNCDCFKNDSEFLRQGMLVSSYLDIVVGTLKYV